MKASTDEVAYATAWQDTPFGGPKIKTNGGEVRGPDSKAEAFETVGCHVKTRDVWPHRYVRTASGMWPMYFGKLASYSSRVNHVVVTSKGPAHGIDGKPTVWTGTFAEYSAMWECD